MDGVRIYWVLSPHTILNRRIIRVHWSSSASRLNPREKIGKKRNNYTHRIHTRATRCRCRGRTDEPRPCCMWQTDILLVCGIRRRRRIWRQRQRGVEQCASADIHIYFCDRKLRNLYTIVNHVGWRWWWWRWQRGFFLSQPTTIYAHACHDRLLGNRLYTLNTLDFFLLFHTWTTDTYVCDQWRRTIILFVCHTSSRNSKQRRETLADETRK